MYVEIKSNPQPRQPPFNIRTSRIQGTRHCWPRIR